MNGILSLSTEGNLFASNVLSGLFCLFIVVYMRFALNNRNNSRVRYYFKRFIEMGAVAILADTLSYVFDTQTFASAKVFNHITVSLSLVFSAYVGYVWNRFFDIVFRLNNRKGLRKTLYFLPTALIFALVVINPYFDLIFTIDSHNVYARGPLIYLAFALEYLGYLAVALRAIFFRFKVKTLRHVRLRNSFIWTGLVMLVFGALQVLGEGRIAVQCYGISVGIFIMFLRFQDDQITNDILTGLNNRYALDTYIEDKFRTYHNGTHSGNRLYLILMDINHFKKINDEYGHVEGDRALRTVSATLKTVGSRYRSSLFIARYGGDEFAAVFEAISERRVAKLCSEIKETLMADTEGFEYSLTVGTGWALYEGGEMTLDTLYTAADKNLYEDKDRVKEIVEQGLPTDKNADI